MADQGMQGNDRHGAARGSTDDGCMLSRRTLIKIGWTVPVVAMTVAPRGVFATASVPGNNQLSCSDPQGLAMNCIVTADGSRNDWGVSALTVGGKTYSAYEAYTILNEPAQSNWMQVFHQLVAAQLNIERTRSYYNNPQFYPADPAIVNAIDTCNGWMKTATRESNWTATVAAAHDILSKDLNNNQEFFW